VIITFILSVPYLAIDASRHDLAAADGDDLAVM